MKNDIIKHNFDEEAFALTELKETASELDEIYRSIWDITDRAKQCWADDQSSKLFAKSDTLNELLLDNCNELDEIVKQISDISKKMYLAEQEAKRTTED